MSAASQISPRHLLVLHYHLRPGGVRRVIELTLPDIIRAMPSIGRVTLVVGECCDERWIFQLRQRLPDVDFQILDESAVGYFSESVLSVKTMEGRLEEVFNRILPEGEESVIWAHNLGLARNLVLAEVVARFAARDGVRLVSHHHDFWFENRWNRWPEFEPSGADSLDEVGDRIFSKGAKVAFATINRLDLHGLSKFARGQSAWLPNPADLHPLVEPDAIRAARKWLIDQLGEDAPVWILPARFLRRKNIAEALLIMRWLCPQAWLVTTAAPSSADEQPVYEALSNFAREHELRHKFAVLANAGPGAPSVDHLVAASDGVIVTSIQEGFGLPYLEASAMAKPIIARRLLNVFPDLQRLGLRFSNSYSEVWIHPDLLNMEAERLRQKERWDRWLSQLPAVARREAGEPWIFGWKRGGALAFSRLTLEGQMEVLAVDPTTSWHVSRRWNHKLQDIRKRMETNKLHADAIAPKLHEQLSVKTYAEKFWKLADQADVLSPHAPAKIQRTMMIRCLNDEFFYPLLW